MTHLLISMYLSQSFGVLTVNFLLQSNSSSYFDQNMIRSLIYGLLAVVAVVHSAIISLPESSRCIEQDLFALADIAK